MNEYIYLGKIKHLEKNNKLYLSEQIIIKEKNDGTKFTILCFKNNTKITIDKLKLVLIEYDESNILIDKNTYDLNNLNSNPFEMIMPYEKFKINNNTQRIKLEIYYETDETTKLTLINGIEKDVQNENFSMTIELKSPMKFPTWIYILMLTIFIVSMVLFFFIYNAEILKL